MEKPAQHIIRNNLLALLLAAVVLGLANKALEQTGAILFCMLYLSQAFVNMIFGFTHLGRGQKGVGAAPYFLSMLLVLIIGFGACTGIVTMGGGLGKMY
ncbi:hypothetical protein GCM10022409_39650 [Hymenobacter glaciei]|uniref:Uncharacterized protein n=1 Tax=Hymenobacter glaciei TaxID=877209 RepID=A0ABP7URR7_9BACT